MTSQSTPDQFTASIRIPFLGRLMTRHGLQVRRAYAARRQLSLDGFRVYAFGPFVFVRDRRVTP